MGSQAARRGLRALSLGTLLVLGMLCVYAMSATLADAKTAPHSAPRHAAVHYGGAKVSLGVHVAPTRQQLAAEAARAGFSRTAAGPTNMRNYGGPVMSGTVIYDIYWVPAGATAPNQSLLDQFAGDLSGPFVNMLAQYGVPNQLNFGGSWVDTKALPSVPTHNGNPVLQDSDVQGIVTDAQNANSQWQAPGLHTLYMVYLPEGTELCDSGNGCTYAPNNSGPNNFCAYHSAFTYSSDPSQTPNVYAAMPWDGDRMNGCSTGTVTSGYNGSTGPNNDPATDSEISTSSHEIFEALTDPLVGANTAWNGGDNPVDPNFDRPGEIGDLCAYMYNPTLGDGGDVTLNGNRYFIQYEWDNATSSCILPNSAIPANSLSPGCTANPLPANDDGSSPVVGLPFTINFMGASYGSVYVNNNGNLTFAQPQSTFTPYPLSSTNTAIIAPFFADVDTRGTSPVTSGLATYGTTTYAGHQAFCVLWQNVGYYGAHTDKLNTFEVLLVERPDTGPGDFDIVFNYDKVQWETGDASSGSGGLGGYSARAGFSNGNPASSLELNGSGIPGSLIDSGTQSLTAGSNGSAQPGRYIYPIRNGNNAGTSVITGQVTDTATPANPQVGAIVQACNYTSGTACSVATTNATGNYSINNLGGGSYTVTVSPPSGSSLNQATQDVTVAGTGDTQTANFALSGPTPPPPGTTVGGVGTTGGGIPVVYWQSSSPLTTTGCANGTGSYTVTADNSQTGAVQTVTGSLTESPVGSGQYTGSVPALYPLHGNGTLNITITCGATTQGTSFSIYIDPSGNVVDQNGNPIPGATVTLESADDPSGPFTPVPNGSAVMSPANRTNPDTTRPDGSFGWDVTAGYYIVTAQKPGCTDPANPANNYVQSAVMNIPPAVTGLRLVLNCAPPAARLTVSPATGDFGDAGPVSATLTDNTGAPLSGKTVSFTLNGAETCSGTTDGSGVARCSVTPGEATGGYPLSASFAGDSSASGVTASGTFTVTAEQTAAQYTGPTTLTNGAPATLRGALTQDGGAPLAGQTLTLSIGSGAGAQACMASTDASGTASCTIAAVHQSGTQAPVGVAYAGDSHFAPSTQSATATLVTPAPTPIPKPTGPGSASVSGPVTLSIGNVASLKVACTGATGATCTGTATLTYTERHKHIRKVHGRKTTVITLTKVTLGKVSYHLSAGRSETLTLSLSGPAATRLRAAAPTRISVAVLASGQAHPLIVSLPLRVVRPAPHHHGKGH